MVEIDFRLLVARAVKWHRGQLGNAEQPAFIDTHVMGPMLHGGVHEPTRFHTYACLYPERGIYVVYNTGEWDGLMIGAQEVRQIIAGFAPSQERVAQQRQIARRYTDAATVVTRWDHAVAWAMRFDLPVAFVAFGRTARENALVAYQRSVATAPLRRLAHEFLIAAPLPLDAKE